MISLVIPIYNTKAYLKDCLDSVLAQTLPDLQIILVDDGSTDGSAAIAREYVRQDTRVEYYHQQHAGQSAARNLGLTYAKGEYIAFVDADDYIDPDWCQKHLDAISGVNYVQSGYTRSGRHLAPATNHQFTSPCMRLYRRETIAKQQFAPGFIYEDVLFSADLWMSGAKCRRINYAGYIYTLNPNSTTSVPHPEARRAVIDMLREKTKEANLRGKLILWYTIIRLQCHFILR